MKEKKKEKKRKIFDCIRGRNKESAACLVPSFLPLTNFPAFSVCARLFNFYEALVQSWGRSAIETRKEGKAASRSDCNSILSNVEQKYIVLERLSCRLHKYYICFSVFSFSSYLDHVPSRTYRFLSWMENLSRWIVEESDLDEEIEDYG